MYGLCCQAVTVYRRSQDQVLRQVVEGCYLESRDILHQDAAGSRRQRKFLLVMPGNIQRVFPGDRILAGRGPEITPEDWDTFLPALVPGLQEAAWVKRFTLDGRLQHVEAGN